MPESTGFPLAESQLKELATKASEEALASATEYDHISAQTWNQTIINNLMESLVTATTPADGSNPPYKFAINSTIIQNVAGGGGPEKRGMYSSVGAYWNEAKDGMWSFKYDAGSRLGMDIVLSVIWISI
ncbi:putative dynein light chain protein [Microthyrium microscopicum]|uniref:Putative dynein light chain protein n=1 Tax=Microthyrium microscopicum TaxID=703497 RepID=A0A6A6UN70_9PEZI|nr:putative dynein light chain protein [Microthyrium microscopicum]